MKKLFLLIMFPFVINGQGNALSSRISTLSVSQLNEDFTLFRNALEEAHPGLYYFASKDSMDKCFDRASTSFNKELNVLDFYRALCPVVSKIGCEHTGIEPPRQLWLNIKGFTKYFPMSLDVIGNTAYITNNYTPDTNFRTGADIISINGMAISQIINKMNSCITADGYPRSKESLISSDFPFNYLLYIAHPDSFEIKLSISGKESIIKTQGLTLSEIRKNYELNHPNVGNKPFIYKALSYKLHRDSNLAYLSVNSFGKNNLKLAKQNFRKFIDKFFKEINEKNIGNIIIDLRSNTGGEDENSQHLFTWLADKPFHIDRSLPIKISHKPSFWKYTNKPFIVNMAKFYVSKTDSGFYVTRKRYFKNYYPAKNGYKGKIYILVDGQTGSAASQFSALVQSENRGTIIGQETRGSYMGGNSGDGLILTLPNSKLNIYIPFVKVNLNVKPREKGRGVIPDLVVKRNKEYFFSGKDVMALEALKLILNSKN